MLTQSCFIRLLKLLCSPKMAASTNLVRYILFAIYVLYVKCQQVSLVNTACYTCTNLNMPVQELLVQVDDSDLRNTIASRLVPVIPRCGDPFDANLALQAGTLIEPCADGVCVKLWFPYAGEEGVWRGCINPSNTNNMQDPFVRYQNMRYRRQEECRRHNSERGVCMCSYNLCNFASVHTFSVLLLLIGLCVSRLVW